MAYDKELTVKFDVDSCRKDLERACAGILERMAPIDEKFQLHKCDTAGCKEGFVMADGIEKVRDGMDNS